jgi:hypothetical protein
MLKLNMDSVGEAAIVECEGAICGGDEALQLYEAVTGRAADRVIVIDLSRVSVTGGKGLSMLLCDLGHAASPCELDFVSLGEVMAVLTDAVNRQTLAA